MFVTSYTTTTTPGCSHCVCMCVGRGGGGISCYTYSSLIQKGGGSLVPRPRLKNHGLGVVQIKSDSQTVARSLRRSPCQHSREYTAPAYTTIQQQLRVTMTTRSRPLTHHSDIGARNMHSLHTDVHTSCLLRERKKAVESIL